MPNDTLVGQPSTSTAYGQPMMDEHGVKRPLYNPAGGGYAEDTIFAATPSNDRNEWYYPSHFASDSDDGELVAGRSFGNWGRKTAKEARWVRRGKLAAWGPAREDWELEERARKRLRQLLPQSRSPSPPTLPHLREDTPPPETYAPPNTEHNSYASFLLDQSIAQSFRSRLPQDLQRSTENLIEGEATLKQTLGRLWQVISEDPDGLTREAEADVYVAKREEGDGEGDELTEREKRLLRAPELTPPMHKLFLTPVLGEPFVEPSALVDPQVQLGTLEKSLMAIKELQDDSREYVERLEEIREGLGDLRTQRDLVWRKIRENALEELQKLATSAESGQEG